MFGVDMTDQIVFFSEDPRLEGCSLPIIEDADYSDVSSSRWVDGGDSPRLCHGRSNENPAVFRTFGFVSELQRAGFAPCQTLIQTNLSWGQYNQSRGSQSAPPTSP